MPWVRPIYRSRQRFAGRVAPPDGKYGGGNRAPTGVAIRRIFSAAAIVAGLIWAPEATAARPVQERPASIVSSGNDGDPEIGSELRVWLVTAAPGDAVWERYGHNAIRVLDTSSGRDVSYNWGIFDFQQTDFIPRFLQGRMLYMMAPFPTQAMIDSYARTDREVVLQELNLTPAQKVALRDFADRNALTENRDYLYQYFLDNCSTRVRDLLDLVLGGALRERFESVERGTSYRYHTQRLTQVDPLIYLGMDLLLGAPTDQTISVWEEMFIPMTLRDEIRDLVIAGPDGEARPLVLSEETVVSSSRPAEPAAPPGWLVLYIAVGLALGGLIASAAHPRVRATPSLRRAVLTLSVSWTLLAGLLGTILVLLLFTDHTFAYRNENLFLFNPGVLVLAPMLGLGAFSDLWRRRAASLALFLAGVALVGLLWQLLPMSSHDNAIFVALGLPAHLALALSGRARATATPS